jgi:hypothetical protein
MSAEPAAAGVAVNFWLIEIEFQQAKNCGGRQGFEWSSTD